MLLYGVLSTSKVLKCERIHRKENIKVLMESLLVRFIRQEMRILHAKLLIKHFKKIDEDLCFMPYLIQIIINIVTLGCGSNIYMELQYTYL
jgi:hypothetical protein